MRLQERSQCHGPPVRVSLPGSKRDRVGPRLYGRQSNQLPLEKGYKRWVGDKIHSKAGLLFLSIFASLSWFKARRAVNVASAS